MARKHDRVERLRLLASQSLAALVVAAIAVSDSRWAGDTLYGEFLFLLGCVLVGLGSLGRLWCSVYIAGYKSNRLVVVGPYSVTRNPLYFFSLLGALGVGLATETMTFPIVVALLFAVYYPFVIKSEEARLAAGHGEDFQNYLKSTPAFFPKWSLLVEPEKYEMMPRVFRRHMGAALWFVWLLGLLEVVEGLHELQLVPVLFRLY